VRVLIVFLFAAAPVAPAFAQGSRVPVKLDDTPAISLRPFFVFAEERFSAQQTFDAVFGGSSQPLWGGGLSVAFRKGFYVDVTASRFKKTGQRAFFSGGQAFGLGIPLTATLTPIELTAGGRFRLTPRLFPYVGAGVGSYGYQETSEFDDGPFAARHVGYVVTGGLEYRVSRWVAVSGDAQYTRVSGIIGSGGVSQQTGDTDLGGIAGRFRVMVGR
jgi:hypothetical protein